MSTIIGLVSTFRLPLQPNPCSSRTQRGHNPERLPPHPTPPTNK